MRVHELAKELGVKSKALLEALETMGYGGRTASSSVPDETVARLRASGGKAVPGARPKQIEVEQLPAKRAVKEAPVAEDVGAAAPAGEGNGQVASAEEVVPPEAEVAPTVPQPEESAAIGFPILKVGRGATPQDIAAKI